MQGPRTQQYLGLDVFRSAVRLGLVENAGEAVENLQEGRDGRVVEGHGCSFNG